MTFIIRSLHAFTACMPFVYTHNNYTVLHNCHMQACVYIHMYNVYVYIHVYNNKMDKLYNSGFAFNSNAMGLFRRIYVYYTNVNVCTIIIIIQGI